MTVPEATALLVIILWPIIPLWWIPVLGAKKFIRKLGFAMYPITFALWIISAYPIYMNRVFLMGFHIDFFTPIRILGILFAIVGAFLQLWVLKVLSARVITGLPEIINGGEVRLVSRGPFSRVRHPTYLSHTLFFFGIFLSTGIIAAGLVALFDFLIITLVVIPMEERGLLRRFGNEYRLYMVRTPRFIPRMRKLAPTGNEVNPHNTSNFSKLA